MKFCPARSVKLLVLALIWWLAAFAWAQSTVTYAPTCTPWSVEDTSDPDAEVNDCYCVKNPDGEGCKAACEASAFQVASSGDTADTCCAGDPNNPKCQWPNFYDSSGSGGFDPDDSNEKKCLATFRDNISSCCYGHKDYSLANMPDHCVNPWSEEINSYLTVLSGNKRFEVFDGIECWIYPKSTITTVMDCLYNAFDHIAEDTITTVVASMMGITGALSLLVFILMTIRMSLGASRDMRKDFLETMGLILFVMVFCFNPDVLVSIRGGIINLSNVVSNAALTNLHDGGVNGDMLGCTNEDGTRGASAEIINAAEEMANSQAPGGVHQRFATITLFAYFDCIMFNVLGLGDSESFTFDKSRYIGIGGLLLSVLPLGGIGMFFLALFVGLMLSVIVAVTTCLMMYLVAMVAITFIIIIMPIMIPMLYFPFTRKFFTTLINHIFVYTLIVVFNTIGIIFYINITGASAQEFSVALEEHLKIDDMSEVSSFLTQDSDDATSLGSEAEKQKMFELIKKNTDKGAVFDTYFKDAATDPSTAIGSLNDLLSGNSFLNEEMLAKFQSGLSNAKGINAAAIDINGIRSFLAYFFKFIIIHVLFAGFLKSLPAMADKLVGEGIVTNIQDPSKALANPEIPIFGMKSTQIISGNINALGQQMQQNSPVNQMISGITNMLGKR